MPEYSTSYKVVRVVNATAAGTTDINGTAVDMDGFDSVEFVALYGALTATQVTSLKAESSDSSSTGFAAITGAATTALADGDGNKAQRLEVYKPQKRYVRCVVDRGTANAVVDGVVAILHGPAIKPVTQDATVVSAVVA